MDSVRWVKISTETVSLHIAGVPQSKLRVHHFSNVCIQSYVPCHTDSVENVSISAVKKETLLLSVGIEIRRLLPLLNSKTPTVIKKKKCSVNDTKGNLTLSLQLELRKVLSQKIIAITPRFSLKSIENIR